MLALSRRAGERLLCILPDGRAIAVKVVAVTATDRVKLGVDAPEDVMVYREEVYERMMESGTLPVEEFRRIEEVLEHRDQTDADERKRLVQEGKDSD